MFDHAGPALDHEREETLVVDIPDDPATEVIHVPQMSADAPPSSWHRLTPNHQRTSCGLEFDVAFTTLRRESLTGPLCVKCFTDYERLVAADVAAKEQAAIDNRPSTRQWLDDQEVLAGARIDRNSKPNGKKRK